MFMQRSHKFVDILFISFLGVLIIAAFFTLSPYRVPVPHRDSGIFLHIGSEILQGKVLYLQTWDNKQPLLYYINALGLWVGRGSAWGVWGLELAFFLATLTIAYRILRTTLLPSGSFFVVTASFLSIYQFMSGNFSEEYALLFQVGILALMFFVYLPNQKRFARPLAACGIGVLIGLVFCIKQTYLDVAISVFLFLLFLAWVEKNRQVISHILLMGLGFLLANSPFFIYFLAQGALNDYITSAFLFNKYYSNLGLLEWVHSILEKFEFLSSNPFLAIMGSVWLGSVLVVLTRGREVFQGILANRNSKWVALVAGFLCWALFFWAQARGGSSGVGLLQWVVLIPGTIFIGGGLLLFFRKPGPTSSMGLDATHLRHVLERMDWIHPGPTALLFLGLIDLPIVLVTISLSGKDFAHYYVSLFPALFLLLAGGLTYLNQIIGHTTKPVILNCLLAALLISGSFAPGLHIWTYLSEPGTRDTRSETAAYLNSVTAPQDKILVWGWESVVYFLAEREPPTRYGFQFPAYLDSPYKQAVLTTLLEDIKAEPPLYIADTMDAGMPLVEGRLGDECLSGSRMDDAQLLAIISFVCSNYKFDRKIGNINIYKLHANK
jgi:hypothetical protein